ncbi:hypothetical protein [Sphaerobacter thermophilus]|uniref:Uncharacterized protein n=1 Tax=Sphaerobacter thermophilus (strain ATCC 49802 / DSM 20745 / KCCM 41009 / NCIMB 13125 / S 6022) TaxID=479434 RepID=D1C6M8_SPHTD|nr:hypothetical protein [Sphaerobacter thermophilus]ACZ39653.1 hypothetical protein Sthe_2231 [Sphaerobacter thermophilus DSM 20745]
MTIIPFRRPGEVAAPPPGMVDLPALVTRYVEALKEDGIDQPLTELYTLGWVLADLCQMAGVPVPPALEGPHLEWMDEPTPA